MLAVCRVQYSGIGGFITFGLRRTLERWLVLSSLFISGENKYNSNPTRDEPIYDNLRPRSGQWQCCRWYRPCHSQADSNIHECRIVGCKGRQVQAYMCVCWDRIYFECNAAKSSTTCWGPQVKKRWKIDVEVDSSSYRISCNPALRKPRKRDCLSSAYELHGLAIPGG